MMVKPPPAPTPTFPLLVIDFEATALTLESYPIEVGLAIAHDRHSDIAVRSTLIAPDPSWNMDEQWDPDAERIHGISRWQLRQGMATANVMEQLNSLVGDGSTVWCDGGHYDAHWLSTLASAAGIVQRFVLGDLSAILAIDDAYRQRYRNALRGSAVPHRAGPDAQRIADALIMALAMSAH